MTLEQRIELLLLRHRGDVSAPALAGYDVDLVRTIYNLILLKWLLHEKTSPPDPESDLLLHSQMILTNAGTRRLDLLERMAFSTME
jgi:hypothetical protein